MSSLHMDGSGSRSLNLTLNDVAATHTGMPSRNDDDVSVQLNSIAELSFVLPPGARLERRTFKQFTGTGDDRRQIADAEHLVVVIGSREKGGMASLAMIGRNRDPDLVASGDAYGLHPMVHVSARKGLPESFIERGEVTEKTTVADVLVQLGGQPAPTDDEG